jgi:phage regulator Rha-like protein
MEENNTIIKQNDIENRIFTIRGSQIMLDTHLAEMYGVPTKVLNQAVKRNIERFPEPFRFQLTEVELNNVNLKSQFVTSSSEHGGRRTLPYAYTEQGVAMLSAVLHSETAVKVSIRIIQAFVEMRKMVLGNATLFQRLDRMELKQLETDQKFEQVFKALESRNPIPEKGIFFDGQVFDAWTFISDLIRSAKISLVLIDNYVDDTVLKLFTKRNKGVSATIYTKAISKQLATDLQKHNKQYEPIAIEEFSASHDRFLLIDETELYHIGASLKDLGKKWFAFSKMETQTLEMLNLLKIKINE